MSILSTELRIGNWVLSPNGEYKQVKNIQEKSINLLIDGDGVCGAYQLDGYNGISLTPEILEKCGFEMDASYQCPLWKNIKGFEFWDKYGTGAYSYRFMNAFDVELKYLHQLQTLYWCLCGKELIINL